MQEFGDNEKEITGVGYPSREEPVDEPAEERHKEYNEDPDNSESGQPDYMSDNGAGNGTNTPDAPQGGGKENPQDAYQAEYGNIPQEDAKFREVNDLEPSVMYTPGICGNDPYRQRIPNDDMPKAKKRGKSTPGRKFTSS